MLEDIEGLAAHAVGLLTERAGHGQVPDPAQGADPLVDACRALEAIPVPRYGTLGQALRQAAGDPTILREALVAVTAALPTIRQSRICCVRRRPHNVRPRSPRRQRRTRDPIRAASTSPRTATLTSGTRRSPAAISV
jgi:hypothetical protein